MFFQCYLIVGLRLNGFCETQRVDNNVWKIRRVEIGRSLELILAWTVTVLADQRKRSESTCGSEASEHYKIKVATLKIRVGLSK